VAALDDRLEAVVRAGFPGAVAVASGPGFHEEGAAGVADVETGERLTPKHRFRIASVTKIFVATVVLQLVDEGALDLDGDAAPIAEGVTIRQLLNHTSGFQDFFDDIVEFFEPYRQDPAYRWPLSHGEVLALIKERPLLFPPGTGWSYTGSNYLPLGLLIEETTGTSLAEQLRRRITEPLGLDATLLHAGVPAPEGTARGYLPPDNPLVPGPGLVDATDLDMSFSWAGGGMVSTAADVARFLQALLGGEVLPDQLRAEMLRTVPSDWPETDAYGLGIAEISSLQRKADSPCGSAWGHLGFSASGYMTIALASASGDRQVVIMTNGLPGSDEVWETLGRVVWPSYCA
jgi:D-alanyl-D-alanine carboxypeptidase